MSVKDHLSEEQKQSLGDDRINAIVILVHAERSSGSNKKELVSEAIEQVSALNDTQVKGINKGLLLEDVKHESFGKHVVEAIDNLTKKWKKSGQPLDEDRLWNKISVKNEHGKFQRWKTEEELSTKSSGKPILGKFTGSLRNKNNAELGQAAPSR